MQGISLENVPTEEVLQEAEGYRGSASRSDLN